MERLTNGQKNKEIVTLKRTDRNLRRIKLVWKPRRVDKVTETFKKGDR